jgi:hypothetical protein
MSVANAARKQTQEAAPQMSSSSPRASQSVPVKSQRSGFGFAGADTEDQFKLNLSDIPKLPSTMEVEGFKPSLLARLVGLVVRN